jgi:hypothetical protein
VLSPREDGIAFGLWSVPPGDVEGGFALPGMPVSFTGEGDVLVWVTSLRSSYTGWRIPGLSTGPRGEEPVLPEIRGP